MMGNYQVRFLGDKGGVIRLRYPTNQNTKIEMMKVRILMLFFSFLATMIFGQVPISWCNSTYHIENGYTFDFNTTPDSSGYYFLIDTTQLNNIWQTGNVTKDYFTTGYNGPRALVTDTINSYPLNNNSSFIFSVINCTGVAGGAYTGMYVAFNYSINSDSLIDGGIIEVSHNNGLTWTNIIQDTIASPTFSGFYSLIDTISSIGKPGFSGTVKNGYCQIHYNRNFIKDNDTVSFKLTFGSDSIQTHKDGWMIERIYTKGVYTSINEIRVVDLFIMYPNPSNSKVSIKIKTPLGRNPRIQLLSITGEIIKEIVVTENTFSFTNLSKGIYLVKYLDDVKYAVKKLIVNE
jgi:hypothetical protein